jgi:glycosyltransferase involved in cell wall biosynthesis
MSEKKTILVIDEYSANSYLYHFIKRYQHHLPHLVIVKTHLHKWRDFRIGMNRENGCAEYHMPLVNVPDLSQEKKFKKGNRILDFLLLEGIVGKDEPVVFLLNNSSVYYLVDAVRNRMQAKIIVYVDTFEWEHRSMDTYAAAAALFRREEHDEGSLRPLRTKNELFLFGVADAIWCYNEAHRAFITQVYGIDASRTTVCPYVPFSQGEGLIDPLLMRERMAISPGEKVILFYYVPFEENALKTFFEAIAILLARFRSFRVIVAGKFIPAGIQDSMEDIVLCRTIFLGDRTMDELLLFVKMADLVVTLPGKEIKSTFCMDALLSGIPVISSPFSMSDELKEQYRTQIRLIAQPFAGEIADTIRKALSIQEVTDSIPERPFLSFPVQEEGKKKFLEQLAII